jgi:protein-disulfide isomerase
MPPPLCLLGCLALVAVGCGASAAPAASGAASPAVAARGDDDAAARAIGEAAAAQAAADRAVAEAAARRAAEVAAALDEARGLTWYGGDVYGGDSYGGDTPAIAAYVPKIVVPGGDPEVYRARAKADPAIAYHVPVGTSVVDGAPTALITLVVGIDIATPYGPRLLATIDELRATYGAELRVVWKHLLSSSMAQVGALALCAAGKQRAFEPMLRAVQARRYTTSAEGLPVIDPADAHRHLDALRQIATELKLDVRRWERDLRSKACHEQVITDLRRLLMLGTTSTPMSWVNGRPVLGGRAAAAFIPLIDEELAKARAATAGGAIAPDAYYAAAIEHGPKLVRLPRP